MMRIPMHDYARCHAAFRWALPQTFNFAADVVDAWAADPAKLALLWCDESGREERYTFADMSRLSARFANVLAARGIGRGDRVLVMLPRIPQWQIAMTGCLRAGAIPIPCVEMLTAKDVAYRLGHAGAVAVVTTASSVSKVDPATPLRLRLSVGAAPGWDTFADAMDAAADAFAPATMAIEEPAVIYYTSGSTGDPKGVTHAARGLYTWRVSSWYWQDLTERDLIWCTADTGWSKAGTSILFAPWSCGAAVLFHDGRFDARRRFELLERHRVTVFCAAATELRRLVLEDVGGFDLSGLRLTLSAGELVNPEIVRRWREVVGGPVLDGYGQTETLMTVLNYGPMPVKPGSMGRPLPGTDVAILDGDDRLLPRGASGRLVVKLPNPQLMLGYWNDPQRTADTRIAVDGVEYFISGDMARIDEDGYVFYEGRADDVINSAGYRIGPMEVENALMEHPAVQECAAVASPDPARGEVVKAFVVLKPGHAASDALAHELQAHAKRVTAPYKYPRRIAFVDDLPKTVSGKLRRRLLRDREFGIA
jgi:acyl-coenzyme A synthetase/AMP-(fatty) acid ligase